MKINIRATPAEEYVESVLLHTQIPNAVQSHEEKIAQRQNKEKEKRKGNPGIAATLSHAPFPDTFM